MNLLPILLAIPLSGVILSLLARGSKRVSSLVGAATIIFLIVTAGFVAYRAWDGEILVHGIGNWPEGLGLGLAVDMLGGVMVLIVSVIGGLALIYSMGELKDDGKYPHFVATTLFLLTGLIGIIMTTDLFNLFVFVEISSVSAYVLVALRGGKFELEASLKYMILGTITGLLFLTGIATMYDQVGALNMGAIAERLSEMEGENVVVEFSTLLILIGVGLPAAIFPLHTWLVDAYSRAPSAVSALLSGVSAKVAIYAMVRLFYQSFGLDSVGVLDLLPWAGLATAIFGALLALIQTDLKRLLAYTTVSSGGFSLLLISMATDVGFESLFMHLLNHTMAKTLLFLSAGVMIHVFSTREIPDMKGAWGRVPWLCSAFVLGAVCDFGGPSLGFLGKAKMFLGLADGGWFTIAVAGAAVVLVAVSYLRVIQVLVSAENGIGSGIIGIPRTMIAPIVVLVVICILLGLLAWTIQDQAGMVAAQIMDRLEMVASMVVM